MAFLTTALIIAGAALATGGAAAAYHGAQGSGPANKVTSALDLKRKRDAEKAYKELSGHIESNGRYFVPQQDRGLVGARPSFAAKSAQPLQKAMPAIRALPALQTGYRWQEYQPQQMQQLQKKSELFVDRTDTYANNGIVSTYGNMQRDAGKFLKGSKIPRWLLGLATLGFSEVYAQTASLIDNYIWDIDGDGKDSMLKNIFVDPWIEVSEGRANAGQALLGIGLNLLNGAGEVFDVLANPIKGIANNGWQGFLDAVGAGGNGYVAFDWNTNNFVLDLVLETLSDPLSVIDLSRGGLKLVRGVERKLTGNVGKNIAKQTVKELPEQTIRKISRKVNINIDESLSKAASKKYTDKLTDIVKTQGDKQIQRLGSQLALGSSEQFTATGRKLVPTIVKQGDKYIPTADVLQQTEENILQGILYQAHKAKIPLNLDSVKNLKEGITDYLKDIKLCDLTTQIIGTTGILQKQARLLKEPKLLNLLTKAQTVSDNFQRGLSKIAYYGLLPGVPLTYQIIKHTPFRNTLNLVLERGVGLLSATAGKLTNRVAYNFQKAIAKAAKELTPESYAIMRKAYTWASNEALNVLEDSVKIGSKKVLAKNKMLSQTSTGAFQKLWIQKFNADTTYYNKLMRTQAKSKMALPGNPWEEYIAKQYKMSPEAYLNFMEQINALEKELIGNDIYRVYINQIKSNNIINEAYALNGLLTRNPSKLRPLVNTNLQQGKPLSKKTLEELNVQTMSKLEFDQAAPLSTDQIFRQTNNKVYVENELFGLFQKEVEDFLANDSSSLLFKLNKELEYPGITKFVQHFEQAQKIQNCFKRFACMPGLYAGLPKNIKPDYLYLALVDSFMGLNSKVAGLDDISNIAFEMASVAELQLKQYANITEDISGILLKDLDFMESLKVSLELYASELPKGSKFIVELRDCLEDLKPLIQDDYFINTIKISFKENVFEQFHTLMGKAFDTIEDASSTLIVIPTELARTGMDLVNSNSLQGTLIDALIRSANSEPIDGGLALAGTLTTLSNGHNLNLFFSKVPQGVKWDRATLQDVQKIADGASQIYNRIYSRVMVDSASDLVNKAWQDLVFGLNNSPAVEGTIAGPLYYMLQFTLGLEPTKKYALLKYFSELDIAPNSSLGGIHTLLSDYIKAPNNSKLYALLKNFNRCTNKPVVIGTGLSVQRARNILLTTPNLQVSNDIQNIMHEKEQVARSLGDIEAQIKNVSNADPLLAQHLEYSKQVNNFYKEHVTRYQELVEAGINQKVISRNLKNMELIMADPSTAQFFNQEDLDTLRDIYNNVVDIDPAKIDQLVYRTEAYNKTVLSPDMFKEELEVAIYMANKRGINGLSYEDFVKILEKNRDGIPLTEPEAFRYKKCYKQIDEQYQDFAKIMLAEDLTDSDLTTLYDKYASKLKYYDLVPNAMKAEFIKEYRLANNVHITLDKGTVGGFTGLAGYGISVGLRNAYSGCLATFKHESTHSLLAFQDLRTHRQTVNEFWTHLLNGENAAFAEQLYISTFYSYLASPEVGLNSHYFKGDSTFTWNNLDIQEEVMANIISAVTDTDNLAALNRYYHIEALEFLTKNNINVPEFINKELTFKLDEDTQALIDLYYNKLIRDRVSQSPNKIFEMKALHQGARLDISEPYKQVGSLIHNFNEANRDRTNLMLRKRLKQSPQELAEDLARTGPFHFYSLQSIRQAGGKYSLYKYFDKDFNINPQLQKILKEQYGVGIEIIPEYDTLMFYIDKSQVAFADGVSYYKRQKVNYQSLKFDYKSKQWNSILDKSGEAFNNAAYAITGISTGYSNGFKVDDNFINTLFNGTKDGFNTDFPTWPGLNNLKKDIGGWTAQDLLQPIYYPSIRFNEMLLGHSSYSRRFGIYLSNNPIVNMSNALQQMNIMNKTKTEMLTLFFDDMFAVSGNGIWAGYSDADLFKAYMEHPEYVMVTMRGKSKKQQLVDQKTNGITKALLGNDWNPVRLQEFIPYDVTDIKKAREIGVRFVPKSWYNMMYNTINNRIGSGGILKWFNRYNFIYKFFTLATNIMTFVRNGIDTYMKNTLELQDDFIPWTGYAYKLQRDYQDIRHALDARQIYGDKAIKEFFESGESLAYTRHHMTYDMFKDLQNYEAWGPSTQGLADLISNSAKTGNANVLSITPKMDLDTLVKLEPSNDELMRNIAKEVVPGYKGVWEHAVDFTSRYFDIGNKFFGADAEKVNRLALYLKAISEGKTKQQAFQWIANVHFDYSVRNIYEQVSEVLMPFITFTTKNLVYWIDAIATKPSVQKFLMNYFQTEWNYYDFDSEQMAASNQWQYLIKTGNIPLNRKGNMLDYFKLNPSFADAFNTFINPLEVAKERLFFPTRALEKTFTEDYKGQNLMGKQPIWNQVMDWTSQIPGNALARRITKAIKSEDTLQALRESMGAVGQAYLPAQPYIPGRNYGYRQRVKYIYTNNYNSVKPTIQTNSYKINKTYANKYRYDTVKLNNYKRARGTNLGKRILNPKRMLGQNLTKNLYFNYNLYKPNPNYNRTYKRVYTMNQYRIQKAMYR